MEATINTRTDTELRILQAAEEEFMRHGLEGSRTTAIAERAGVTHAMLHYYFRTKATLFEQIIARKMQELGRVMLSVFVAGDMPLTERIRRGIEQHFDYVRANPDLPLFIMREIYAHPERHALMQSQLTPIAGGLLRDLQRHIDRSAATGETVPMDARTLIIDIISLNIFTFISFPLARPLLGQMAEDEEQYYASRKAENVEVILRRLQKI